MYKKRGAANLRHLVFYEILYIYIQANRAVVTAIDLVVNGSVPYFLLDAVRNDKVINAPARIRFPGFAHI